MEREVLVNRQVAEHGVVRVVAVKTFAVETLEGYRVTDEAVLQEYITPGTDKYNAMVEVIRKELGLTSLKYQTLDNLIKAIGLPKERVCTYCYDGCDPTAGCACKCCHKKDNEEK